MAVFRFGGILNAARWPLIAALQGRTVIQPLYDAVNKVRRGFGGTEESEDKSVPQLMYCENAMPTVEGIQSVGYQQLVGASGNTDFDQAMILRDSLENNYIYSPSNGKNYFLDSATLVWSQIGAIGGVPAGTVVSRAYVNGRTFVCYAGINIYEYNHAGVTFNPVAITLPPGVLITDIVGVGGSNNYLLIFTATGIYWSSLIDPTDFTPSVTTGAGNGTPQDVKGNIVAVQGTAGGFIIYSSRNAVAAQFTNNIRQPFVFKEIAGCGGILTNEQITSDTSSGVQYAWTTNGLQRITLQFAEVVSAEVNDFIAGRATMTWDANNNILVEAVSALGEFKVKITLVAGRFLCLSYSDDTSTITQFQFCLVYDLQLKRWGQLKLPHVDVFPLMISTGGTGGLTFTDLGTATFTDLGNKTFNDLINTVTSSLGTPTSKRELALLQADGTIQLALMDYNKNLNHNGVIIFGRHQLTRQRMITHQISTIEGVYSPDFFDAFIINSLDGYDLSNVQQLTVSYTKGFQTAYAMRVTGLNQCLVFTGTFALSSYIMEVSLDGSN